VSFLKILKITHIVIIASVFDIIIAPRRDKNILKELFMEKRKLTVASYRKMKANKEKIVMVTAYDAPGANIAAAAGVSAQDAAEALFSTAPLRSLDEPAFDEDDGATLMQTVSDEDETHRNFERLSLKLAIEKLSPIEKKIISLRYFRDYSQCEVARLVGMTQVKVSRTEKKILERLKKEIEG
jgi:RNA polymerase sporulation-specific sigma factor